MKRFLLWLIRLNGLLDESHENSSAVRSVFIDTPRRISAVCCPNTLCYKNSKASTKQHKCQLKLVGVRGEKNGSFSVGWRLADNQRGTIGRTVQQDCQKTERQKEREKCLQGGGGGDAAQRTKKRIYSFGALFTITFSWSMSATAVKLRLSAGRTRAHTLAALENIAKHTRNRALLGAGAYTI